jgi:lysozyme
MGLTKLEKLLIKHEGLKLKPYRDSVGKLTIGVGRNLDDCGITENEAYYLLENDIEKFIGELLKFDWFKELDEVREGIILNMTFNLGIAKLLQFKNMIEALKVKDYKKASNEMLNSKWATQVKNRAFELAQMMLIGEYLYEP